MPPDVPPLNLFDPYYWVVHLPLLFVLGACFGSFFNVCIYRIPLGVPLSMPPSHCYQCGRGVRWFDNIPLISYWTLKGRCRHCGAPFSVRYFMVELLTALLFVGAYLRIGHSPALLPALVFLSLLIIATFTDIDHWIIPDRISVGGMVAGMVLAAIWPLGLAGGNPLAADVFPVGRPLVALVNSLAGALAGFLILWGVGVLGRMIFRKDAMGWGDIKLFAMFGAFMGLEPLVYTLVIACLVGAIAGTVGIILGRMRAGAPAPAAIAPLQLDPEQAKALMTSAALGAEEREIVGRALNHPGAVGPVRHHLPFGPSLALAAAVVYLYFAPIQEAFYRYTLWRY